MLTDDVRTRLEQLNRAPLPAPAVAEPPLRAPAVAAHLVEEAPSSTGSTRELPAGEQVDNPAGRHWLVRRPLSKLWPGSGRAVAHYVARCRDCPASSSDVQRFARAFPDDVVLLDLETCGLAGSMIFLVGLLHCAGDQLVLTQLLARNYAEERAVLCSLWPIAAQARVLVTFNGKSFDWPQVKDRSTLHRLGQRPSPAADELSDDDVPVAEVIDRLAHFDLLHHARRRWGKQLPNCKLQTLEHHLCGRRRVDDIPGRDIPAAYHQFVRSGDAWPMRSILHHNALDLVTLLQLALLMLDE